MQSVKALSPLDKFLAFPVVDRTRRNHGLEHATITMLSRKYRGLSLVGRSTPSGFYLYGQVSTEAVTEAAQEALQRMRNGEAVLAVHPNCGTNFVTAGVAAGLAAFVGFLGANDWRARWTRLPIVAVLTTAALIFAQPVGLELQRRVTTSGEMREMEIVRVTRKVRGSITTHFVATQG
jgi:hypothetical protein